MHFCSYCCWFGLQWLWFISPYTLLVWVVWNSLLGTRNIGLYSKISNIICASLYNITKPSFIPKAYYNWLYIIVCVCVSFIWATRFWKERPQPLLKRNITGITLGSARTDFYIPVNSLLILKTAYFKYNVVFISLSLVTCDQWTLPREKAQGKFSRQSACHSVSCARKMTS